MISIKYILGLIEGEGCFFYNKYINKKNWTQVQTSFCIVMHRRDSNLLRLVRKILGIGKIREYDYESPRVIFSITNKKDLKRLIKIIDSNGGFFGYKKAQYIKWKKDNSF